MLSDKRLTEIIEAMVSASGMSPVWEDDFYENSSGTTRANFMNGLVLQFGIKNDHHMFHHNNSEWLDTPSSTVIFWVEHKNMLFDHAEAA